MGIEALTMDADGRTVVPGTDDEWREWVAASRTRSYAVGDPLLDWLDLYGEERGFQRDDELPGYDPRTDFREFIFRRGNAFESAVLDHLRTLAPVTQIQPEGEVGSRDLGRAEETFAAMQRGEPIIYQGVLRDAETRTYGAPDLLVRSDVLAGLFPDAVPEGEVEHPAPGIGSMLWHYRVVDIKFTTVRLLAGGDITGSGSTRPYRVQLYIYNRALGRLQAYLPPASYVLGRSWRGQVDGEETRGRGCMERLGRVPQESKASRGTSLGVAADEAVEWVRRVRVEGMHWTATPEPSLPQLMPNMRNTSDGPWHSAKLEIERRLASNPWVQDDDAAQSQGVGAGQIAFWPLGEQLPETDFSVVSPAKVSAGSDVWRNPGAAFYVDFETVSDLNDDFSQMPQRGGANLIFLIGCGHLEGRRWRFRSFLVDDMSPRAEADMIDRWFAHMSGVKSRLGQEDAEPVVFHWSNAEASLFETAYDSAVNRHPGRNWPRVRWFDFLNEVMRREPVRVEGARGHGLKAVGQAMRRQRVIQSDWADDSSLDGLGAMVGALWAAGHARERGVPLQEVDLMQDIIRYNETDCKVMMEVIEYLRRFR